MKRLVSSRDIESCGLNWAMIDNFESVINNTAIGTPIIVNTDHSKSAGVHWIAMMKIRNNKLYIYDPLGPNNPRLSSSGESADTYLKDWNVVWFPYASQMKRSDDCGYFAIMVANHIKGLTSPKQITQAIISLFGKSADGGDEKRLKKYFQ